VTFQQAGAFALKAGRSQDAVRFLRDGIDLARQNMTPSSSGIYAFRRIALELYVGVFPAEEILPWVETAAKEFAGDIEESQRRLDGIVRHLDEVIASIRVETGVLTGTAREAREKDLRRQLVEKGWTLFCLARSAQLALASKTDERLRAVVLEASSKAASAFEEAGETETRDRLAKALRA
jgi:hypothetical protein